MPLAINRRIQVMVSGFSLLVGMTITDCADCGTIFAVTDEFDQRRQYDGATFFCPSGHRNAYTGVKAQLEKDLAETRRKLERAETRVIRLNAEVDQIAAEKAGVERSRAAIQGQLTKVRRRATNGVCTSCNRSFANVLRHMQTKHPDHVDGRHFG